MLKTGIILEICEAFLQYVNSICRSKSRKICETLIAWNLKTVEDIDKKLRISTIISNVATMVNR